MLILNRLVGERIYIGRYSLTVDAIDPHSARLLVVDYERAYTRTVVLGHGMKLDPQIFVFVLRGRARTCWPEIRVGIKAPINIPIERDDIIKGRQAA